MITKGRVFWRCAATLVLILGAVSPAAWAQVEEFEIFIEINDTDGDAGIQLFIDGDGWDRLKLYDPFRDLILQIRGGGGVGLQGLTEALFESAEPSFEVQPIEEFFALFPEGTYRLASRSTERGWTRLEAELTHCLPAAPEILFPQEEAEVDPDSVVTIMWEEVTEFYEDSGEDCGEAPTIIDYEVIVELDDDEAPERVFSALVGPEILDLTVPDEFLEAGQPYKVEVLAREESGNRTITEVEFETEE